MRNEKGEKEGASHWENPVRHLTGIAAGPLDGARRQEASHAVRLYIQPIVIYITSIMRSNLLYVMIFYVALSGCGGGAYRPAPVEEPVQARAAPRSAVPRAPAPVAPQATAPVQRAAPEHSELLFQVLTSIGVDYKYGGNSHATGFDCSGLVAHVFREGYGVRLPRTSMDQSRVGQPVSADELQPGDLVFYNTLNRPFSHVGIYLGDGRFIHAPKTGAAVRIESLRSTYWSKRWNGARRIEVQI